jgi:uncharacterized protein with GYD domain
MATYVGLLNWTPQGVVDLKGSPGRLDAAREAFAALGAELKSFYMTMGRYDMVVVAEVPDDATMAKALLAVVSGGSVRTETLRAFTEDEYRGIIGSLP